MTGIEGGEAAAPVHAQVEAEPGKKHREGSWGVWLFRAMVAATLVYFWWLLIYSHGVAPHHP